MGSAVFTEKDHLAEILLDKKEEIYTGNIDMARTSGELVRSTITIPKALKRRMREAKTNWSEFIREAISRRLEEESEPDVTEAVILNERVRRSAPPGWSSSDVIKRWRRKH